MTTRNSKSSRPLGWEDCPGVTRNPRRVGGAWTFGNSRLPLYIVFQNLAAGASASEIAQWYDNLSEEQIQQVLSHAARMLEEDRIKEEALQ